MKTFSFVTKVLASGILFVDGMQLTASANDRESEQYAYVMVTGSNIPQKIKLHRIGTKTTVPINVYNRREIDQTGRFNTEGAIGALDPSINVINGHGSGH